ncbi:MAG: hypothetical protein Q8P39_00490 [Candidatus Yanofskybacteria bacterium]|nr:hypothetical protein [Candidatus Yanofskybacteria bacterium]
MEEALQAAVAEDGVARISSISLCAERDGWISVTLLGIQEEGELARIAIYRCASHAVHLLEEDLNRWVGEHRIQLSSLVSVQEEVDGIYYLVVAGSVREDE